MNAASLQNTARNLAPSSLYTIFIDKDLRDKVHSSLKLAGFKLSVRGPSKRVYRNAARSKIEVLMA